MNFRLKGNGRFLTLSALVLLFAKFGCSQSNLFNKKGPALPDFNPGVFNKQGPATTNDLISQIHSWQSENGENDYIFNPFDEDSVPIVDSPVVQTEFGIIYGRTYQESHAFYSVPYAVPPIEELRYKNLYFNKVFLFYLTFVRKVCAKSSVTLLIKAKHSLNKKILTALNKNESFIM